MKTYKVLPKKVYEFDIDTRDVYEKEVNVYLVQLTEKEYCKAKRIFKEGESTAWYNMYTCIGNLEEKKGNEDFK